MGARAFYPETSPKRSNEDGVCVAEPGKVERDFCGKETPSLTGGCEVIFSEVWNVVWKGKN